MPENKSVIDLIDPKDYSHAVHLLRNFFIKKGFLDVPVQHRLSILAACEDPRTIGEFHYAGNVWPLPQTGQMWLEYELLKNPEAPGFFCISTSYRNEPHPVPGRHNLIFPIFEFETHGTIDDLMKLEKELLEFLGFGKPENYKELEYKNAARDLGVVELTGEHEKILADKFGPVIFLKNFPELTSPFWNMRRTTDGYSNKIDVLLYGIETIGSAERSIDPEEMRHRFETISGGLYAEILYARFGRARVEKELDEFLSNKFIERCGGGIGMTRIIRALKLLK